jgi:hypothetical protein
VPAQVLPACSKERHVGRYAAALAVDQLDASDLSVPYLDESAAGSGGRNFALLCRSCNADKTLDDDIPLPTPPS